MRSLFIIIFLQFTYLGVKGQSHSYHVTLSPIEIPEIGGLQSYAIATHGGDWLIVGGRLDGLHRRQPFASFNASGNNDQIIVVNPETKKVWKKSVESLPENIREQLASTNIQFYQEEDRLLLVGGYAFSPSQNDHITFPYLTVLDIPRIIEKVKQGEIDSSDFQQFEHESFRVTGGQLEKIDSTYFLVGGHKFMGRYNPMGPTHGPGFEQEYTNEIRKFTITFGPQIEVDVKTPMRDETHLHRRDYNLVPTINKGKYELMLYSGVFQKEQNIPWLYPVRIEKDSFEPLESFTQYYNHYHCATLPIYDAESEEMHTLFFGGIAQFYEENELLVQDNDVPFVNTIADISQLQNGEMREKKLSTEMPGYLGAGSEFIISPNTSLYADNIINGASIENEPVEVGYIFGGIRSSDRNIFFLNTGAESEANSTIYKVSLNKLETTHSAVVQKDEIKLMIYPNPARNYIRMSIHLEYPEDIEMTIYNTSGKKVYSGTISKDDLDIGENHLMLEKADVGYGAYFYEIRTGDRVMNRKVIWTE